MAGPHRLVSAARHALAAVFADLPIGSPVLLAVSGGPDSLALAASACYAARERAIRLYSLTVDHGIRPESAAEAAAVCQQLRAWGIEADIAKVQLGVGDGPEEKLAVRVMRRWRRGQSKSAWCRMMEIANLLWCF